MARALRWAAGALTLLSLALSSVASADPAVHWIAGGATAQLGADGSPATQANISPWDVSAHRHWEGATSRDFFIADYFNCRVRRVNADSNLVSDTGTIQTVLGNGCGTGSTGVETTPISVSGVRIGSPQQVSATWDGGFYVAERAFVHKVDSSGFSTKAGRGTCGVSTGAAATQTGFCNFTALLANDGYPPAPGSPPPAGDPTLFLAADDPPSGQPVVIDVRESGAWVTLVGGCSQDPGATAAAKLCLQDPRGLAWGNGYGGDYGVFLVDAGLRKVIRFGFDGSASVVAGTGDATAQNKSNLGDGGKASEATFSSPNGVTMGYDGALYISDGGSNCRIRRVYPANGNGTITSLTGGDCSDFETRQETTVPAGQAKLVNVAGIDMAPTGILIASSGQIRLVDRTSITAGPPLYHPSRTANFTLEGLETNASFDCGLMNLGSICGSAPEFTASSDGFQSLLAATRAKTACCPTYQGDPTPAYRDWYADTVPPAAPELVSPAPGASGLSPEPDFSWKAVTGDELDRYELVVDSLAPVSVTCASGTCAGKAAAPLSEGNHAWKVVSVDKAGHRTESASRSFSSGSAPTATFAMAPNPTLTGRTVTFDGSGSSDASGPIAKHEWDLDGDGAFDAEGATVARAYATPGVVSVTLRVTDGVGLTAAATQELRITSAVNAGELGVTIDNGAQYTRTPDVTVAAKFPPSITSMLFSNDGGFLAPLSFPPQAQTRWRLDSSGPERLPKIVYVRFVTGAFRSETFTDDIILDETPPTVSQATLAGAAAAQAARVRTWTLKLRASDSNSGVAGVHVTADKRRPGKLLRYRRTLKVKLPARPKFARAKDKAGNFSRWRKVR